MEYTLSLVSIIYGLVGGAPLLFRDTPLFRNVHTHTHTHTHTHARTHAHTVYRTAQSWGEDTLSGSLEESCRRSH